MRWTALGSVLAVSASLLGGAVFAAPAHAVANTVVSLTFDDANDNQFAAATTMRNANLRGTFFVNSGFLNAPEYMTTAQVQQLQRDGHEIGGHSVTHPDLAVTGTDEARRQVCNDRVNLTSMGLDIRSFAYPFASSNPAAEAIVRDCGYNSARGLGDIRSKNPESATFPVAETIPPANLFYTGAPDQVDSTWTLADLQNVVTQSVNGGGGWVQLTFHHVGRDGEPLSIPSTVFAQYTNWLRDEVAAGRIEVKPVRDVIPGGTKPIVAGPAAPAPITSGNLLQNPGLQTPSSVAGVPKCWAFGGFGVNTPVFSQVAGRTSTIAQQLTMTNYVDGDAKLLPTLDLGECAPGAVPGRAYVMKAWYKSTGPTQFELYYRTGLGTWRYWTSSPLFNAAADWTQLTFTSPPVPEGASAISMGLNLTSNGTLVTDDYELTVSGTTPPPPPPPAPAPTPPAAVAAINAAAAASPGVGTATGAVVCGLVSNGCYQNYQNGAIHWTQATGARITRGAIAATWAGQRWENGPLGYPTSNEVGGLKNGGVYQNFQGGTVHWTPATGARITKGAIGAAWAAQGWENGGLGYPTGNEVTGLRNGGAYQNFQGGVVHWSPTTGARITRGAIDAAWASFNWENGFLGYPTSNEIVGLRNGGVYQNFQGGVIYWSPATGARSNAGAIRNAYASQGWENGRLGYPTTNEFRLSATVVAQDFQGGRITWSAATGSAITYR